MTADPNTPAPRPTPAAPIVVHAKTVDGKPLTADQLRDLQEYIDEMPPSTPTEIGTAIHELRLYCGFGLRQFAEQCGIWPSDMASLEAGRHSWELLSTGEQRNIICELGKAARERRKREGAKAAEAPAPAAPQPKGARLSEAELNDFRNASFGLHVRIVVGQIDMHANHLLDHLLAHIDAIEAELVDAKREIAAADAIIDTYNDNQKYVRTCVEMHGGEWNEEFDIAHNATKALVDAYEKWDDCEKQLGTCRSENAKLARELSERDYSRRMACAELEAVCQELAGARKRLSVLTWPERAVQRLVDQTQRMHEDDQRIILERGNKIAELREQLAELQKRFVTDLTKLPPCPDWMRRDAGPININTGEVIADLNRRLAEACSDYTAAQSQINAYRTYGQGGASFQESQLIERLSQAERERDEAEKRYEDTAAERTKWRREYHKKAPARDPLDKSRGFICPRCKGVIGVVSFNTGNAWASCGAPGFKGCGWMGDWSEVQAEQSRDATMESELASTKTQADQIASECGQARNQLSALKSRHDGLRRACEDGLPVIEADVAELIKLRPGSYQSTWRLKNIKTAAALAEQPAPADNAGYKEAIAKSREPIIRLSCEVCDEQHDGITPAQLAALVQAGWRDIDEVGPSEDAMDWETHTGTCPECAAKEEQRAPACGKQAKDSKTSTSFKAAADIEAETPVIAGIDPGSPEGSHSVRRAVEQNGQEAGAMKEAPVALEHSQRAYLLSVGWEQVMAEEEDGLESWRVPWEKRESWPEWAEKSNGMQHHWDLSEAVEFQRQLESGRDVEVVPKSALEASEAKARELEAECAAMRIRIDEFISAVDKHNSALYEREPNPAAIRSAHDAWNKFRNSKDNLKESLASDAGRAFAERMAKMERFAGEVRDAWCGVELAYGVERALEKLDKTQPQAETK